MPFIQTETTKDFIKAVKTLVESRQHGRLKDIAKKLDDYNYSALNQIMNGGRNVPDHVYSRFRELYNNVQADVQKKEPPQAAPLETSIFTLTETNKQLAMELIESHKFLRQLFNSVPQPTIPVVQAHPGKVVEDHPVREDLSLHKKYAGKAHKKDR